MTDNIIFRASRMLLCLVFLPVLPVVPSTGQELVDKILAVVNGEVITLTDVRIADEFSLFSGGPENGAEGTREILERYIDQKLVLQISGREVFVRGEEIDAFLRQMAGKIGYPAANEKLESFGLAWDDLRNYIREHIIFQKIIEQKFNKSVVISLDEIESYYNRVYLPVQKEKGKPVRPMMEILDVIESVLREQKVREQVDNWIEGLRRRAEIQVKWNSP